MEDSLSRNYVNISNHHFQHRVYDEEDTELFSYKPGAAFWLSLESKNQSFKSQWDEEFGSAYSSDSSGNLHVTTVRLKPNTYVMSPEQDATLIEGLTKFVEDKKQAGQALSSMQIRQLLLELVKKHCGEKFEYVICQIDLIEDIDALEKLFGNFEFGKDYPDEVYDNLIVKVKRGIRQSFSGLEVTGFALGLNELQADDGAEEILQIRRFKEPRYQGSIEYFDIHSMAIFDTSCLDIVKEKEYTADVGNDKQELEL